MLTLRKVEKIKRSLTTLIYALEALTGNRTISSVNVTSEGTVLITFVIIADHVCANSVSYWSLDEAVTKIKGLKERNILIHRGISVAAENSKIGCGNQWILGRLTCIFSSATATKIGISAG